MSCPSWVSVAECTFTVRLQLAEGSCLCLCVNDVFHVAILISFCDQLLEIFSFLVAFFQNYLNKLIFIVLPLPVLGFCYDRVIFQSVLTYYSNDEYSNE